MVFRHGGLIPSWSQLVEFAGERRAGGEDWGAFWDRVDDVDDGGVCGAELGEQGGDGGFGGLDVGGCEGAVDVPVRSLVRGWS
jgi:hypothetical protein